MEFVIKTVDGGLINLPKLEDISQMVPTHIGATIAPTDDVLKMTFNGATFYFSYEDTFYHSAMENGNLTESNAETFMNAFAAQLGDLCGQNFEVIQIA